MSNIKTQEEEVNQVIESAKLAPATVEGWVKVAFANKHSKKARAVSYGFNYQKKGDFVVGQIIENAWSGNKETHTVGNVCQVLAIIEEQETETPPTAKEVFDEMATNATQDAAFVNLTSLYSLLFAEGATEAEKEKYQFAADLVEHVIKAGDLNAEKLDAVLSQLREEQFQAFAK